MSGGRFVFFARSAGLLGVVLGACHEPSQSSSVAPPPNAPGEQPAPVSSTRGDTHGGAGLEPTGWASDAGSPSAPSGSAAVATPDAASASIPASTDGGPTPEGDDAAHALLDAEGKSLPQTEQRPSASSARFRQRIEALAQAIISGQVEPALASFFPLAAYAQVKDVEKPERDYKFRLLANFKRDVLEYHRELGAAASQAKLTDVMVLEKSARWMEPGSEGNKLGYFRVLRSRLRFALPAGKYRDFELTSLISWRGEWYVVHLHGFK